jgi:hypothetical protein
MNALMNRSWGGCEGLAGAYNEYSNRSGENFGDDPSIRTPLPCAFTTKKMSSNEVAEKGIMVRQASDLRCHALWQARYGS